MNKNFIFSILVILFICNISFASAEEYTKIAPSGLMESGTGNWGGLDREFLTTSYADTFQATGDVSVIKFNVENKDDLTKFHYTVWRKDGATYDKIGDSGDLISQIVTGTNEITIDPISVQQGDYYGYIIQTSADNYPFYAVAGGSTVKIDGGVTSITDFDWDTCLDYAFVLPIEAYTTTEFALTTKVAPYSLIKISNTPNWGGYDRYFIQTGQNDRIRQNGDINSLKFHISNKDNIIDFKYCIWRKDGSTYDLIDERTIDVASLNNGINTVSITPLSVQEGDYYGYYVNQIGESDWGLYVDASDTTHKGYYATATDITTTNMDWENDVDVSITTLIYTIEAFMDDVDVVFIGDSIMAGHPAHYSYIETTQTNDLTSTIEYQFGQVSDLSYQNMGIGGQTTTQIKARFASDVINLHPNYVVIEGGVNDVAGAVDSATILSNYEWMIDTALANDVQPFVILILSWTNGDIAQNQQIDYINAELITMCEEKSIEYIDARQEIGEFRVGGDDGNYWNIQSQYNADGVHFNSAGHGVIAGEIDIVIDAYIASLIVPETPSTPSTPSSGGGGTVAPISVTTEEVMIEEIIIEETNESEEPNYMQIIVLGLFLTLIIVYLYNYKNK